MSRTSPVMTPAPPNFLGSCTHPHVPDCDCARCSHITEYAGDMLSVHDVDAAFTYRYASPAAMRLFGYAPAALIGKSAFAFIHPDDHAGVETSAALLRECNETVTATYRFRSRDGEFTWVESTCRPVPHPTTGAPVEIIATTRSAEARVAATAEQARLLRDASDARAAAEAADRTKDAFLAMMSHEFRTPLNAIAGHLDLLQLGIHGPLLDAQRDSLGRIGRAQHYLLRLVNDLLDIERLRKGRLEYDLEPLHISDVVRGLEPLIGPQLASKSLQFTVTIGEADVAIADRDKLAQVLINLISNAVKFTPEGGRVTVDCPRPDNEPAAEDRCFIRVRDTGVGIPDDMQSSVFEPFVQVDVSRSRRAQGAGLGLAISRDLSRGMGGDLRVRAIEGKGASFTVSLRRAAPSDIGAPITA